jgi:hypothetical protein
MPIGGFVSKSKWVLEINPLEIKISISYVKSIKLIASYSIGYNFDYYSW